MKDGSKKKRGRPKGKKNIPVKYSAAIGHRCPSCGMGDFIRIKKIKSMPYAGVHDGKTYTSIVFTRSVCKNCGQRTVLKDYLA
jgi:ribosomal protein S27AE